MQKDASFLPSNLRQIEPIKIRDIRISIRKSKTDLVTKNRKISVENLTSTTAGQRSVTHIKNSFSTVQFSENEKFLKFSNIFESVGNIKETCEKNEFDDDSVILELNKLLCENELTTNHSNRALIKERPMKVKKIKLKEKNIVLSLSQKPQKFNSLRIH